MAPSIPFRVIITLHSIIINIIIITRGQNGDLHKQKHDYRIQEIGARGQRSVLNKAGKTLVYVKLVCVHVCVGEAEGIYITLSRVQYSDPRGNSTRVRHSNCSGFSGSVDAWSGQLSQHV